MKKMLVSGMLSSLLAVSAVWGEGLPEDAEQYLSFLEEMEFLNGKYKHLTSCDNPNSKGCNDLIKKYCGVAPEKICVNGVKSDFTSQRQMSNAIALNSDFIYKQMGKGYDKKIFKNTLNQAHNKGIRINSILLNNDALTTIATNNLTEQATDIVSVYGTIKNNDEILKKIKRYKKNKAIQILLGE